jgi:hypothetical protein
MSKTFTNKELFGKKALNEYGVMGMHWGARAEKKAHSNSVRRFGQDAANHRDTVALQASNYKLDLKTLSDHGDRMPTSAINKRTRAYIKDKHISGYHAGIVPRGGFSSGKKQGSFLKTYRKHFGAGGEARVPGTRSRGW